MKRILVISNMYPGKRSRTFGIFVKNHVEILRSRGFEIDVLGIRDPRMGKKFVIQKYMKWLGKFAWLLLKNRKKYDVIHAHYVFPSGLLARIFKKISGAGMIVTSHGGDIDRMARKNNLIAGETKRILRDADAVIAAGEGLRQDIISDFGGDPEKISVLSMGVDRNKFYPRDKSVSKKMLGLEENSFHILYVGNIIKAKGIEELVNGFREVEKQNRNVHLHLVGEVKEPDFYNEVKAAIPESSRSSIHFHPSVNQNKLAEWMSAADLFVLPSHLEGLGLVAIEAMACHTPVLGTRVGGLQYVLADGRGELVEPQNERALAESMNKLINDPELRKTYAEQGETMAQKHDLEVVVRQLGQMYEKMGEK
ncbi:glycosyltransferase [Salimicrobium album]|uniref:Glycosyltransferase involved in cell wall bisynthesis n=1 Tax=Salimicrobium album TaxID=50717 RepID=A0A1H3EM22_9BACI|nr:glycosyltransferase [Salimicrobium album]SDX79816.1 Glycosyltransferase involved in cell wall bisynthesis [Salimicrobium album]